MCLVCRRTNIGSYVVGVDVDGGGGVRQIRLEQEESLEITEVNDGIDHDVGGLEENSANIEQKQKKQKRGRMKGYSSVDETDGSSGIVSSSKENPSEQKQTQRKCNENDWNQESDDNLHRHHTDTATFDFVGLTSMLFDEPILPDDSFVTDAFDADTLSDEGGGETHESAARHRYYHHRQVTYKHIFTKIVLAVYYINIFLVLGNYILVMSHAVSAMVGEDQLCFSTAGIIASTLMLALSQIRTMANLGRSVSVASLLALLIVVIQCLYSLQGADKDGSNEIMEEEEEEYAALLQARLLWHE